MKIDTIFLFLFTGLLIFLSIRYYIRYYNTIYEGFYSSTSQYELLKARLKKDMAAYCQLATYVQAQMKKIYMTAKPSDLSGNTTPGETDQEAIAHIQQTYKDVYACKDEFASSRPTCSGGVRSDSESLNSGFVSCDNYMNLPSDENAGIAVLTNIPDDLANRIEKEIDWYSSVIKILTDAFDQGKSPPTSVPDSPNSPATDSSGKPWTVDSKKEGFSGNKCSPAEAQARLALLKKQKLEDGAASCTMPTLDSEIARINALLDSSKLRTALSKCGAIQAAMVKLQAIQTKAANGTLFDWQQDGPKKSYQTFGGGDRISALTFSMKQNRF